jgi:hypothetical protein
VIDALSGALVRVATAPVAARALGKL